MRTIALIEDDRDLQELLRYRLQREGYRLAIRSTGKAAIDFLSRNRPDLLLLDIMLPHTPGLEICKSVRADPRLEGLPIIILSARGSESDRVTGLELGANDYLVKPFFLRELIARIKLHIAPKTDQEPRLAGGGLELFVLEGGLEEGGTQLGPQSWLRLPPASRSSAIAGPAGARLWIKSGHLRRVSAPRPT